MRVLVIDDEKFVADTLVMILQRSGWEATAAYNGNMALQIADSFQPAVVISDVIMPGLNGIEVCQVIHSKYPGCHIILSSGQAASNELVNEAQGKGFDWDLLAKPVEPEDLLALLSPIASKLDS